MGSISGLLETRKSSSLVICFWFTKPSTLIAVWLFMVRSPHSRESSWCHNFNMSTVGQDVQTNLDLVYGTAVRV